MPISSNSQSKTETFNFRLDSALKTEFLAATEIEAQPAAEVLREFIVCYVGRRRRKQFAAEARRQSLRIAASPEEKQVQDWIEDVKDTAGWK